MKNKLLNFSLILTYLLLFNIPYFSHRTTYIIKLIIEFLLFVIIMLIDKKFYFKENKSVILFCFMIILCTFINTSISTRLVTAFVYATQIYLFYVILRKYVLNMGYLELVNNLFKITLAVVLFVDIFVILTNGNGYGKDGILNLYIIGNKFGVSYFNMFLVCISYLKYNISKNINSNNLKPFIICLTFFCLLICRMVDCNTGVIGILIMGFLFLIYNKKKSTINNIFNGYYFIILFILTLLLIVNIDYILNSEFVTKIIVDILHRSPTLTGRVGMYKLTIDAILLKPLFGYGINSTYVYDILSWGNPQNGLLKMLLDFGVFGTVSFLVLCFNSLKIKGSKKLDICVSLYIFLYGMLICSVVEINIGELFFFALSLISILNIDGVKKVLSKTISN